MYLLSRARLIIIDYYVTLAEPESVSSGPQELHMTAWADIQEDWAENSKDINMTGILL